MKTGSGELAAGSKSVRSRALRFVLLVGLLSLFADFTYEGSRSVLGPYLLLLGASGAAVSIISGAGELAGYGLRVVSGRWADASKAFWPITIFGYLVQMIAVPMLALAGNWPMAAGLIILERIGKAIRNPPRDVMLSHAGQQLGGLGWVFGIHEALDQTGALIGPLVVAGVLALRHDYRLAFSILALPAAACLTVLLVARLVFPRPADLQAASPATDRQTALSKRFWIYLAGACLVAAGFADYPLIAYHFAQMREMRAALVPVFYSVGMASSGLGSLVLGRIFDRAGMGLLVGLTVLTAAFAPLIFLGGFWGALAGVALWGLGMGVHESIIPAAVAPMAPAGRRAFAYGLFTAVYGVAWFIGSAIIGVLYDRSVSMAVMFCVAVQLFAVPFFIAARSPGESRPF